MKINISSFIPLVIFMSLFHYGIHAETNQECQARCNRYRQYLALFANTVRSINSKVQICVYNCLNPQNEGSSFIGIPGPITPPPPVYPTRPTPGIWHTLPPQTPSIWHTPPPIPPIVVTPGPTQPIWRTLPPQPPVPITPRPTQHIWYTLPPQPPVPITPRPTQPIWHTRPPQPPVPMTPRPTQHIWHTLAPQPPVPITPRPTQHIWHTRPPQPPVPITPRPTQPIWHTVSSRIPDTRTAAPVNPIYPLPPRPSQYGCGYRRRFGTKIIGGMSGEPCEFPWMVVVKAPTDFCGGAILDRRHILTAAHCTKHSYSNIVFDANQMSVSYGSSERSKLKTVTVEKVFVHPKHNYFRDYDVAVLRLTKDLEFGACAAHICLPTADQKADQKDECVAAGWGIVTEPGVHPRRQPDTIMKVYIPIVDTSLCYKSYGTRYFNDLKLCAGDYVSGGKDTCKGDSGGPLMCRKTGGPYIVFGIVSFGKGCAKPMFPGVYTKVANPAILNYILKAMASS